MNCSTRATGLIPRRDRKRVDYFAVGLICPRSVAFAELVAVSSEQIDGHFPLMFMQETPYPGSPFCSTGRPNDSLRPVARRTIRPCCDHFRAWNVQERSSGAGFQDSQCSWSRAEADPFLSGSTTGRQSLTTRKRIRQPLRSMRLRSMRREMGAPADSRCTCASIGSLNVTIVVA
jgi:hypothetical protein